MEVSLYEKHERVADFTKEDKCRDEWWYKFVLNYVTSLDKM